MNLSHHGDAEAGPELVDFAVNVRAGTPPDWLLAELTAGLADLASYPRQDAAIAAVARRHGRDPAEVLLTAGAAEAFVLIARAFAPRRAVVVHPQFTEPELALRAAGHPVERVLLSAADGFRLDPAMVPADADLVVLGNPTNPTSVLHPAGQLRALARPGRVLVVDEAFIDALPGEPCSLAGAADVAGLVVVRSLTKTWGLPGLRVGYVLAPAGLVRAMAAVQPPWPVSTPALVATVACCTDRAAEEAAAAAIELARQRDYLIAQLDGLPGVRRYGEPRAPFVLVRLAGGRLVREALRDKGFGVRRGDTFPGLGPDWLRIAVRPEHVTNALVDALRVVLADVMD